MKILYCIPSLYNPGGMERILTEKVNYLVSQRKYEILIVTTDQKELLPYFQLDKNVCLINLDLNFSEDFSLNIIKKYILRKLKLKRYKKELTDIINNNQIDICDSLVGKEIEFLSKLNVHCKLIAEMHFSIHFRQQFILSVKSSHIFLWNLFGKFRTFQLIQNMKKLDKIIVLSKNDQEQWEKKRIKTVYIPNFITNTINKTANSEIKSVITVGRLDAQKGYDMLIEAWRLVDRRYPDWKLNIFGKGEWKQMLAQRIDDCQLKDKILLRGVTKNIYDEYVKNSIYIMSSRYEGLPLVLLEAMSCGLPVISFNCEYGPSEIITNNVDGLLVKPNNIEELSEKLCFLIENQSIRKEMGIAAFDKSKNFSKETIMLEWINLFNKLNKEN